MRHKKCAECAAPLPEKPYRNEVGEKICLKCHKTVMAFLTELINEKPKRG